MRSVRTTVSLDPDVAAKLRQLAAERKMSFKSAVNSALRAGLEAGRAPSRPYHEVTADLGVHATVNLTKALRLAAELEDEETIRKLELRK